MRRSAFITVVLLSGAVSGVRDHCAALQLNDTNWKEQLFRCLHTRTSVEVLLTESATPRQLVCDQIRQVGQLVVESMITVPSSSRSKQQDESRTSSPLPTTEDALHVHSRRGLQGQHEQAPNVTLCNSTRITTQRGDFIVEEIEYTTMATGGLSLLVTDANFSLVLPKDLSKGSLTVVVRADDHNLAQDDYYVRSYFFHATTGVHTTESNKTEPQFCKNMGMTMVMYMRGFHMSTSSSSTTLPCLNYYFRSWVLDDRGHFNGAMVYSFLLALLTQCLSAIRAVVVRHVITKGTRKILLITIYTVQQFMGYLIMLVAMMYSVELLFAVVVGVALGNRIFVKGDPPDFRRRRQQRVTTTRTTNELQVSLLEEPTATEQKSKNQ